MFRMFGVLAASPYSLEVVSSTGGLISEKKNADIVENYIGGPFSLPHTMPRPTLYTPF